MKAYHDKNATLVIKDNKKFENDIWQTCENWEGNAKWNECIKYQSNILQKLYNQLLQTEDYCDGCEELYVLGDVINILNNIDVEDATK